MDKVIFAAGGTGGHILPAQALANTLQEKGFEVFFAGKSLSRNALFQKELFAYKDISSATPYRSNLFKAFFALTKGFFQSLTLLKKQIPSLVIGFGSFYTFPILLAARFKKIPYILVESNIQPGRVNRFFSKGAVLNILQFKEAANKLEGKTIEAMMPLWCSGKRAAKSQALKYFGLEEEVFTILIFGGSQGAKVINESVFDLNTQVIHLCGKDQNANALKEKYNMQGIKACVKPFEERMDLAYAAADLCVSRSGSATISELIEYELPAVLIPWPGASDDHQTKNAEILAKKEAALLLEQKKIEKLKENVEFAKSRLVEMRENMKQLKSSKKDIREVIINELQKL